MVCWIHAVVLMTISATDRKARGIVFGSNAVVVDYIVDIPHRLFLCNQSVGPLVVILVSSAVVVLG